MHVLNSPVRKVFLKYLLNSFMSAAMTRLCCLQNLWSIFTAWFFVWANDYFSSYPFKTVLCESLLSFCSGSVAHVVHFEVTFILVAFPCFMDVKLLFRLSAGWLHSIIFHSSEQLKRNIGSKEIIRVWKVNLAHHQGKTAWLL